MKQPLFIFALLLALLLPTTAATKDHDVCQNNRNARLELNGIFNEGTSPDSTFVVSLTDSGTLIDIIGIENVLKVKYLKVSGNLNGTDILAIRKMTNLYILDMSEAHIVDGGASYYESYTTSEDAIGSYFFKENTNLSHIFLPSDIKTIYGFAFSGMTHLEEIEIPASVTSIGARAFYNCTGLNRVSITDLEAWCNIDFDDLYAFLDCNPLYNAHHLFLNGEEIKNLVFPSNVTKIKCRSFAGCEGLTSVVIGNNITTIDFDAFDDCTGLTDLTIGKSVKNIYEAFNGCTSLARVVIEDGHAPLYLSTHYSHVAGSSSSHFSSCPIETLYLGRYLSYSLNSIKTPPFKGFNTIHSLCIGDSVTSINRMEFYGCKGISELTIGKSLKAINDSVFNGCVQLSLLNLPDNITSIGKGTFKNCSSLQVLTLPINLTSIGYQAFKNCSGLTDVISLNTMPPVIQASTFDKATEQNATLRVPAGCRTIYWLHPNWENFATIVEMDPVLVNEIEVTPVTAEVVAGETLQLTAVVQPDNASHKTVTWSSSAPTVATVDSIGMVSALSPGTAVITATTTDGSNLSASCTVTVTPGPSTIITFADANVKALCVQNWDSNGDGELCMAEAAAVTSLNGVFSSKKNITSFDELQYFTGLTAIDDYAFWYCSSLTSIIIPKSVTSITRGVFSYCPSLSSISVASDNTIFDSRDNCNAIIGTYNNMLITGCKNTVIPSTVTEISEDAFRGCSELTNISIPSSVRTISVQAFAYCSALTSIFIPKNVTFIGISAFEYCYSITSIQVDSENSVYDSRDNCNAIINTASNTLVTGYKNTIIPNSVTSIGRYAFDGCSGLSSIIIPNSITSIGPGAFVGCIGLSSITVPNSVTSMGTAAFYGCSGLTSIEIPNTVTSIGNSTFFGCSGLTSFTIHNTVTTIGDNAFWGCSGLTSIDIPNSITSLGNYVFNGCRGLTDVYSHIIDLSKITMGNNVFSINSNDYSRRTLHVPAGTGATYQADERWYPYFGSIVEMGGNPQDSMITFADANVKAICVQNWDTNGDGELSMAEAAAVTSLNGVFKMNDSITSFDELQYFTGLTSIEDDAFYSCSFLSSVIIPDAVTSIGRFAFSYCTSLMGVNIPSGVASIGNYAFSSCQKMASMTVASANTKYDSRNNCNAIIETATNTLIAGCKNTIIPNSLTRIGESAFHYCKSLTSIEIPNSITSIDYGAFMGCTGLTSIEIPSSVSGISFFAFSGCSGLTSITVANDNNYYDSRNNCNALIRTESSTLIRGCENTTIPNSVRYIGHGAFNCCTGLTSIEIPGSVTSIGGMAFDGCSNLTSIVIPNSVTSIGDAAFQFCSSLTSATLPNSITAIDDLVFSHTGLTRIAIPESVTSIGKNAFQHCNNLESVTFPNSISTIAERAFAYCSLLTSIEIPYLVTFIGNEAFYCCTELTDVYSHIINLSGVTMGNSIFTLYPDDYSGRTLHVPVGTANAYQSDERWYPYFGSIVEMEPDATEYFTMPDTAVFRGKTIVIPVAMVNEESIISFQTDIFLPEGLEIVKEDGEYLIDASGRMTRTHSILSDNVSNGAVRVLCYSSNYKPFTGASGDDLFYITVKVADDAAGDYTISLRNTLLTTSDFDEIAAPNATANVHVLAYLLGDANNSGTVTVTDVVVTSQYVLERDPEPFNFDAADVNADGNITVTDVSRIAWMVLNENAANPQLRASALNGIGDHLSGDSVALQPGETRTVNILLDNMLGYSAFQLDLTLPDGLTASNFALTGRAGTHVLDVNTLSNGKTRVLCYSPMMTAISGHEGALLTFDVTANGTVNGDITASDIELVTTDCQTIRPDAFAIGVNSATYLNETDSGRAVARVDYYNAVGQRIEHPTDGVTIVVTTYSDGSRTTAKVYR